MYVSQIMASGTDDALKSAGLVLSGKLPLHRSESYYF